MFEGNRTIEYLGMAKNNLTTADVKPILAVMGKDMFAPEQVEAHQEKVKLRNKIVEDNKKKRAKKQPEDPVPVVDNLESAQARDGDGNEYTQWFLLRCPQFKHLNLCMNKLEDDILTDVEDVLGRTTDDFGFTLTGNPMKGDAIKELQGRIETAHKKAIQVMKNADPNSTAVEQEDIAYKRCSF